MIKFLEKDKRSLNQTIDDMQTQIKALESKIGSSNQNVSRD
jgi:prefoldin subunit 5